MNKPVLSPRVRPSAKLSRLIGQIVEIIRGEGVEPGERLYEFRLAQRLGLSRGPVRKALGLMAQYGLAEAVPHKGYVLRKSFHSDEALKALEEADVSEQQYLAIANDRFEGKLPDVVSEAELMRRYGIKRSEILRLLDRIAAEGWVERKRGYGWTFSRIVSDSSDNAQTVRLRVTLEPAGILEPTFHWDIEKMAAIRQRQERVLKHGTTVFTVAEMFSIGCEFHEAIAECSGNAFLLDALKRINRVRRLYTYRVLPDAARIQRHIEEHLRIFDLLERREREAASALMREHLLRND